MKVSASGETKDPGTATRPAGGIHIVYVYIYICVCFARKGNGPFGFV